MIHYLQFQSDLTRSRTRVDNRRAALDVSLHLLFYHQHVATDIVSHLLLLGHETFNVVQ